MNYILYKTINLINGKVYVGVHKMDIDNPDSYIGCGVTKKDLKKSVNVGFPVAVRKYGYKNFKREILFIYPYTKEGYIDAYNKEAEIVNEDWVKSDDNYNLTIGGFGCASYILSKKVNQYNLNGKFIKTWDAIYLASGDLEICAEGISKCCTGNYKQSGNYQWRYYEGNTNDIDPYESNHKTVYQFDLQGNLIKVWKSISEASNQFKNSKSAAILIRNVCDKKSKYKQAKGYFWSYKHIFDYVSPKDQRIAVACYNDKGELIESFSSIQEAANEYNISAGNICGVISGKHKHCHNLRWRYFYGNTSNIKPLINK